MGAVIVLLLLILIVVVLNLVVTVFSKYEIEEIILGLNQIIKGNKNGSGTSKNQN
jgi:hypothetical protein